MNIQNHLLQGNNIHYVPSPNKSGKFNDGLPDTVIIHFTAGPTALSAINTLTDPAVKASAHIVVDYDGSITQLVPFDEIAWHAGVSAWEERSGLNRYAIGIEVVNPGNLTPVGDMYQAWYGTLYPADKVLKAVHRNETQPRFWHIYTQNQIETVLQLCLLLKNEYGIGYILGHEEVAPDRKIDPGPAFPLNRLRDRVLNNRKEDTPQKAIPVSGKVTASLLNIRLAPQPDSEKIARPLPQGSEVEIIAARNGWLQVKTNVIGWVSGKYIQTDL